MKTFLGFLVGALGVWSVVATTGGISYMNERNELKDELDEIKNRKE